MSDKPDWEKHTDDYYEYIMTWCRDCTKMKECHSWRPHWKYYSPTLCYRKGRGLPIDCRNFTATDKAKHKYRTVDTRHKDVISLFDDKNVVS